MLPRCRTLLGISELPTNDDPLSLSLNLSLPLFYNSRESLKCCVVFSKRLKKKREKKGQFSKIILIFRVILILNEYDL